MPYLRVLPRDAFNESNLMKCVGMLTLLIEDAKLPGWAYNYDGEPFDIEQDPADGSIMVRNIEFTKNGERIGIYTPLNSRRAWPACALGGDYDGGFLFNEDGSVAA